MPFTSRRHEVNYDVALVREDVKNLANTLDDISLY
jgi:hypothetical protein